MHRTLTANIAESIFGIYYVDFKNLPLLVLRLQSYATLLLSKVERIKFFRSDTHFTNFLKYFIMKHLYQFIDICSGWRSAIFTSEKSAMRLAEEHADTFDHSVNLLIYEASLSGATYTLKAVKTYHAYITD